MDKIPFLVPNLVKKESFLNLFSQIERSRVFSNYGPLNSRFEEKVVNEMFDHIGAAVTVNNATTGLILAISQCKRPKGRYALMPSFTFAATPLAAIWCGLEPYFVDISEETWCMKEELVEELVAELGDQIAVVLPYATFGTDLELYYYERLHGSGIPVVVDAASSFGTTGNEGHFGKGFSGLMVFSFHATKAFGIGEGGLVYSGDQQRIQQIRQAGNFGFFGNRESTILGMNSKISEYTAAIALATLEVYKEKIAIRQKIYDGYLQYLSLVGLNKKGWSYYKSRGRIPHQFFSILCPDDEVNQDIVKTLARQHIEVRTYFSPACHQQKLFTGYPSTTLQVTESISRRILSLPLWEEMDEQDVKMIIERIAIQ